MSQIKIQDEKKHTRREVFNSETHAKALLSQRVQTNFDKQDENLVLFWTHLVL